MNATKCGNKCGTRSARVSGIALTASRAAAVGGRYGKKQATSKTNSAKNEDATRKSPRNPTACMTQAAAAGPTVHDSAKNSRNTFMYSGSSLLVIRRRTNKARAQANSCEKVTDAIPSRNTPTSVSQATSRTKA